jgi:hypothetical protein
MILHDQPVYSFLLRSTHACVKSIVLVLSCRPFWVFIDKRGSRGHKVSIMTLFTSLLRNRVSISIVVLMWLFVRRPFWRYALAALCTMAFATFLLPDEMMFFAHHPTLAFAIPFAAGFVGVYLLRNGIEIVAACAMLAVLAVAVYRAIIEAW